MDYKEINKKNLPKWEDTLKYLTEVLDKNSIRYYLSSSGLHYILGEDVYPYDIDLFMSEDDVKKAFGLLKDLAVSDLHIWEDKYLEFQGEHNGIPFEVCEWEKEPLEIITKEFIDFEVAVVR